jgi:DNA methyltransferase 1-associated protein 1
MSSSDVRSILDLPSKEDQASTSTQQNLSRRPAAANRKPDGISRELYALIGDNAPFLAETQAALSATKYRERPKPKIKDAKWYAAILTESTLPVAKVVGRCVHLHL